MKMSFQRLLNKNDLTSNLGNFFSKEEAKYPMVSMSATDANSKKKWIGLFKSLSKPELEAQLDQYWKI